MIAPATLAILLRIVGALQAPTAYDHCDAWHEDHASKLDCDEGA